tara:strand:+ start:143 stop:334 length:192 start_codon:yes stop_codon:yes gene_type:complete
MGLLDKLIDKIVDSAKKKKADSVVTKLTKGNPRFAKAVENHKKSVDALKAEIEAMAKEKGIKL